MVLSPKYTSETNLDHKIFTQLYKVVGIKIFKVTLNNDMIELFARSKKRVGICPACGKNSRSIRSRYSRRLMDLPIGAMKVIIHLLTRKFKCNNLHCPQLIFCEQNPELTAKYSRKTSRVADLLTKILVEVSSIKGSYLSSLLNIGQSSSSCLRIVHNLSIPPPIIPKCIGIDDWAKRKGRSYGTIIVNSETGKAIELIDSRESDDIVDTLSTFEGVSFVTRDRARGYAKAISQVLPKAKQIADKFHLSKNLSDAIHEQIKTQYKYIRQTYLDDHKSEGIDSEQVIKHAHKSEQITPSMKLRFESIKQLKEEGLSDRAIANRLGSSRNTIRRYRTMPTPEPRQRTYRNNYEKFYDIINEGMQNQLTRQAIFQTMQQGGFTGKLTAFNYWFRITFPDYKSRLSQSYVCNTDLLFKTSIFRFNRMSPRRLSIYVCNPQWGVCPKSRVLSEDHTLANEVIDSNEILRTLRGLAISFKQVLGQSDLKMLDCWIILANSSGIDKIKSFVKGLKMDWQAVRNAIKYKWTNGVVEGNVNRLKNKKREMYGRAGFELLRRKVCLSVNG